MPNTRSKKSDTPTQLSSVTAQDMAREISAAIRDLTSVEVRASVIAVNYSGSLSSRGPFKRPSKISFELSTVMGAENAEKAIAQLQSVSAQQMADSFATRLSKIASESYEASPDNMRFGSRKEKVTGMFSVFIALSEDAA